MVYSALAGKCTIQLLTRVLFALSRNDLPPTNARQVKRMSYVGLQWTKFASVQIISRLAFASRNTRNAGRLFRSESEREFVPSFLHITV